MRELRLVALEGIPEIAPGANLANVLSEALQRSGDALCDGDVIVLAQKIVSKAEGRQVRLASVTPTLRAIELAREINKDPRLVELILLESRQVIRTKPGVIIVEHRLGCIMANAGIDQSNVPGNNEDSVVLLVPENPDASARSIRHDLRQAHGVDIAIVINDSFGRAWRHGVTGTAIGVAGIPALIDMRGKPDRNGRTLQVTQIAAADELAAAASLLMGQGSEGRPAVLVRGYPYGTGKGSAADLLRPAGEDLFR